LARTTVTGETVPSRAPADSGAGSRSRSAPATDAAAPWRGRWWRRALVLLALLGVVGPFALSRIAFAASPLGPDQGLYVTVGELIKRGGVPWRDAWDNKPPGTYYLYAGVLAAAPPYTRECVFHGRPFPARDGLHISCAQIALSLFDGLYALATAAVVGWIGRALFGRAVGWLAAVLFAVFASMYQIARLGGLPDLHALLPLSLAFAAAVRFGDTGRGRWLVAAGAATAVAALFKQTGLLALVGLVAWLVGRDLARLGLGGLGHRRGLRGAVSGSALLVLGAAGVLGAAAAIFARLGVLPDMVYQTVLWNVAYVAAPPDGDNFFKRAVQQTLTVFVGSQSGLWIAAVGGALLLPRAIRQDQRLGLLAAWALTAVASVALGNARFNQYYFVVLVPPLAILGAWGLVELWQSSRAVARAWIAVVVGGFAVFSGQGQMEILQDAWYQRITSTRWTAEENVGGALREAQGSLYIWGNASQVYAISGRQPASRYLQSLAISNDFMLNREVHRNRAELMAGLEAAPPRWIAFDTPWLKAQRSLDFPELRALVGREYELANDPKNPIQGGWEVYRHRDGP